jgi:guanylate kinase|tara:strand:+ start:2705 stop:3337 length:633 start_codon:yes stop_codon:yes gene_type:complete
MSVNTPGMMIIISSPSGAGKTTIVKLLSEKFNYRISISHTTRKPRIDELDAKDYFFISKLEFNNLIKKKYFIEHAQVFENLYGTSKDQVISNLKKGKNILFDIDWQGAKQIRNKNFKYKLLTFFILPPSKKELLNRLYKRESNNSEIVMQRMKNFKEDVLHWEDYDFVVINDNVERCYKEIYTQIENFKIGKKLNKNNKLIIQHVKNLIN